MLKPLVACLVITASPDTAPPGGVPAPVAQAAQAGGQGSASLREDPSVLGQGTGAAPRDAGEQPEGMGLLLVKMVLGLGVTLGAIYLSLAYVARRLQQLPGSRGTVVKVVERLPLEPRRTLFVIEAAGEYLLVGAGEGPMSLIAKLDAEKARAMMAQAREAGAGAPRPFWLRLLSGRPGSSSSGNEE